MLITLPRKVAQLFIGLVVSVCTACATPLPSVKTESWARSPLSDSFQERSEEQSLSQFRDSSQKPISPQPAQPAELVFDELQDWKNLELSKADPFAALVSIDATAVTLSALFDGIAEQLSVAWRSSEPLNTLVTWTLPEQPAHVVLDQLAQRYNLLWGVDNGTLSVQGSSAFAAFYPVDYLNLERAFSSRVGLATEVGTIRGVEGSGLGAAANSSSTTIDNVSSQQFWQSLTQDLELWLAADDSDDAKVRWTVNKDAGLISLYAPPNTHRRLKKYLASIAATSQRQVLIEASVVEVLLSDEFEAGIDWQWIAKNLSGVSAVQQLQGSAAQTANSLSRLPTPSGLITFSQQYSQGDFSATFRLLEQFGDARIVSRPQILAMNNQPAVLKVVDNRVYFTVDVERQQSDETTERLTQTQIHTVPVGLVMNVTPHIGADNAVMLNVRPSLSRILGFVNDPNPDLNGANITNGVPEIQVREMESVLRVPNGSVAVIGGLMQSVQDDRDSQLPGLANIPGLGALFGRQKRSRQRTELFIVIKPTVMGTLL